MGKEDAAYDPLDKVDEVKEVLANGGDGLECGDKPTGKEEEASVPTMLEKLGLPGLGTGAWLACVMEAILGSEREVIPLTLPTLGGFGSDLGLRCMKLSICMLAGVAG